MNRHERRAAKARKKLPNILEVKCGQCLRTEETTRYYCYVCGDEAKGWAWRHDPSLLGYGVAHIQCHCGRCEPIDVPLCERCVKSEGSSDVIARKYRNAPDLEIVKGGAYASIESLKRDLATDATGLTKH
jgi:hypothetical protein